MATSDTVRAQLIERGDGWWALVEENGAWRSLGRFLSEPEAVQAARSRIGETGIIDVLHRDEARARDDIEDIADVAEAEIDQESRTARAEAVIDGERRVPVPPGDLDAWTGDADR